MTIPSKRLLLFTAKLGYQTHSFEDAARKLGVQLVYVTDRCHQLEDPWGDQAIPVHFESPEAAAYTVMEAFRGQDVAGILALGDRPAAAAAYAARGLGVRYNHPAAVEACRSKLRMREVFRDAGLHVPWFRNLPIDPTPEPVLLGISHPCVLKPLSLSASQGVVRANNREEFLTAAARVRRLLKSPEILATPRPNLDQMLGESEPIGLEEPLLRHALELPGWNPPRERIASGVMMIPVPKSGVLEAVSGEDVARSIQGITELTITARLHDVIAAWPEGSSYLGFLFARGDTPEKVEQSLREAHEKLSFTITPRLPVEHPATRRMTSQGN